jgi:hypothetical protein
MENKMASKTCIVHNSHILLFSSSNFSVIFYLGIYFKNLIENIFFTKNRNDDHKSDIYE